MLISLDGLAFRHLIGKVVAFRLRFPASARMSSSDGASRGPQQIWVDEARDDADLHAYRLPDGASRGPRQIWVMPRRGDAR